jgi:small GTP-binding protein
MDDTDAPSLVKRIFKVLVVGEMGTGKSCLIRKYTKGLFSEFYKATIGVDFANKDIPWDDHTTVSLQLWDIAGQERRGSMTHIYYQEAVAAFIVFDLTRLTTLDMVEGWKQDIDAKVFTSEDKPIPCLMLGNKVDLCKTQRHGKSAEEISAMAQEWGFVGYFETSAKDGTNIDAAVEALVRYLIENKIEPHGESHGVDVGAEPPQKAKGCCP